MPKMNCLDDLNVGGRRVFVRVDFNVPLQGGRVKNDARIRAALPTIEHLRRQGARVILASHLGRPKGKRAPEFGLEPVAAKLAEILDDEVRLADDCIGDGARKVAQDLRDGQVAMLENLRFHKAEEANDPVFAAELRKLCDVYVNDAFGCAHRAHASVEALPRLCPERAAGRLMFREVEALSKLLGKVDKPFVAVLGGAKVSDKINVLNNLLGRVDVFVIGGAMANTFLAARGLDLGKSLVEADKLGVARDFLRAAQEKGAEVLLPVDLVVAADADAPAGETVPPDRVGPGRAAFDIGPASVAAFKERIAVAGTVFWNGPLGLFEKPPFAQGTHAIAKAIASCSGFTVAGGGDSVAAIGQAGLEKMFGHVSTGGGASLELLEGLKLPGIAALEE
ncbi:MAG: phosphoglycerate kinase [Myxococcales bacterium]|nr:phosphoglycerate kinase [Myxococcales bacterium]